ncbi:DUF1127 domain-containing protein [Mycobacterium tuberculosis]|nr:DUF1127 domain-containing protein [Mycobacterium tuberculosis]
MVLRLGARRQARRALRLSLAHLSDAQLRDIGLMRCGDDYQPYTSGWW